MKKQLGYYEHERRELLQFIPETDVRVLDCGCGRCGLGRSLKKRQLCHYVGIDKVAQDVGFQNNEFEKYYILDLESSIFDDSYGKFDVVVCADFLEHLKDPWGFLKSIKRSISSGGRLVFSIPHIFAPDVLADIQRGLFRYKEAGTLDFTHLRFFTKTTIFQMFARCGYHITAIQAFPSSTLQYQYIGYAEPISESPSIPLLSTIMLTHNKLHLTRACYSSYVDNVDLDSRFYVVDNASTDDTLAYFRQRKDVYNIESQMNVGFPCGNNLALEMVDTNYILLLNNDVIIPKYSIRKMLDYMINNPKVGVLGCVTNECSGPQKIECPKFNSIESIHDFAAKINVVCTPTFIRSPRVVFFCVLLRRELVDKIGLLDEVFGMGNFEDDDYCQRAIRAGYDVGYTPDVFVYHHGSATWKDNPKYFRDLLEKNKKIYEQKWGIGGVL